MKTPQVLRLTKLFLLIFHIKGKEASTCRYRYVGTYGQKIQGNFVVGVSSTNT